MDLKSGLAPKDHSRIYKKVVSATPCMVWRSSWGRPNVTLSLLRLRGPQGLSDFPGPLNLSRPLWTRAWVCLCSTHILGFGSDPKNVRSQWAKEGELEGRVASQVGIWLLTQWHQGREWRREWQGLGRRDRRWGWLEASRSLEFQHIQGPWKASRAPGWKTDPYCSIEQHAESGGVAKAAPNKAGLPDHFSNKSTLSKWWK